MSIERQRGMVGVNKKFDSESHKIYDTKAKNVWIDYLNNKNSKTTMYKSIENPNKHGIDILTLNENGLVIAAWELEVRHGNWKGNINFPFADINCIERKDHQWRKDDEFKRNIPYKLTENAKVYYVQFNDICTRAVIINGSKVLQYPLKEWNNRFVSKNEFVRQVPISETIQITL